jgi:hypothetical protein
MRKFRSALLKEFGFEILRFSVLADFQPLPNQWSELGVSSVRSQHPQDRNSQACHQPPSPGGAHLRTLSAERDRASVGFDFIGFMAHRVRADFSRKIVLNNCRVSVASYRRAARISSCRGWRADGN